MPSDYPPTLDLCITFALVAGAITVWTRLLQWQEQGVSLAVRLAWLCMMAAVGYSAMLHVADLFGLWKLVVTDYQVSRLANSFAFLLLACLAQPRRASCVSSM